MNPLPTSVPVKLTIICGTSGSRKDFVAGWMSHCDGYIDTRWTINPLVGQSNINNYGSMISDIFNNIKNGAIMLDSTSTRSLALTCHVDAESLSQIDLTEFSQYIESGALRLVYINLNGADMIQFHWDRLVKAFLYLGMPAYDSMRKILAPVLKNTFGTQNDVTDEIAINKVLQMISRVKVIRDWPGSAQDPHYRQVKELKKFNLQEIEYSKLFQLGGSHYLCTMLDVSATERLHRYWDVLLPFITAPDTCEAFGQQWSKSMIIE